MGFDFGGGLPPQQHGGGGAPPLYSCGGPPPPFPKLKSPGGIAEARTTGEVPKTLRRQPATFLPPPLSVKEEVTLGGKKGNFLLLSPLWGDVVAVVEVERTRESGKDWVRQRLQNRLPRDHKWSRNQEIKKEPAASL